MNPPAYAQISIDIIAVIINALALIAVIVYVKKTHDIAQANQQSADAMSASVAEMRETRRAESAPYVILYCTIDCDGIRAIIFTIKNIGRTPARDIHFQYKPPLSEITSELPPSPWIKNGFHSLAPNQEVSTVFANLSDYFKGGSRPGIYNVTVSFKNDHGVQFESDCIIDIESQRGLITSTTPTNTEKILKELSTSVKKIADRISK